MEELLFLHTMNLQLFAEDDGSGEKTEKATPRRREEARKKGQVFKSNDLNSAIILIAGTVTLFLTLPYMVETLRAFTELYLVDRTLNEFSSEYISALLYEAIVIMGKLAFPVLLATFVTALLISYLQVGFVFSSEALQPKLERLNPVQGAKRVFSKRALVELGKSLAKIIITGFIVYNTVKAQFHIFPRFVDMELIAAIKLCSAMIFEVAMKVGIVFVIIGVLDYFYQKYEHEKSLKMSKHDIKQEYKQTEGDPLLKSRQKQIQREISMRRMMAEVPRADVVITNPTHFAVALKYEAQIMEAPVVVARGQDYVALKIKEIATASGVIISESPHLARALYYSTEIGDLVPEDLYQAVAEVLAFVYRHKKIVV